MPTSTARTTIQTHGSWLELDTAASMISWAASFSDGPGPVAPAGPVGPVGAVRRVGPVGPVTGEVGPVAAPVGPVGLTSGDSEGSGVTVGFGGLVGEGDSVGGFGAP
ncbi:MAG TPA: hypothetical protein VKC55_08825, partial [Actinomycetota bacterium]|nr:hypothetical protein [Actinomycetota bacterium]